MATTQTVVSRVENGRGLPSIEFVDRYAAALGSPIRLTFGPRALASAKERRERAKAAIVPHCEVGDRESTLLARRLSEIMDDRWAGDPTASYLRFLVEAVPDLGPYEEISPGFKKALAFAAAFYEVIDWGAVPSALEDRPTRSAHLKIARRVLQVIQRAELRRQARAG